MIRRSIIYLILSALSTASLCQAQGTLGAWLESPLKWTKPPAEVQLKERLAEGAVLYFGPDHGFVMVYGTIIQGPQSEGLSHGDGRVVYLGKWSQDGARMHVEYRLVSRTVLKEGETLPGPIQTQDAINKNGTLFLEKMRFHRDSRLDSDLQDVEKGERARLLP